MTQHKVDRLQRLEGYLEEDPGNPVLLADAFETSLIGGDLTAARRHLDAAQAHDLPREEWSFREARLCIVRRDLDGAGSLLAALRTSRPQDPVLDHDLAYVRLLQERHAECRAILAPWMDLRPGARVATPPEVLDALQVLWLRAMHRENLLQEAWTWAEEARATRALLSRAAGVASLIAIDRSDFPAARELSEASVQGGGCPPEALVARAIVALAQRDAAHALHLLQQALDLHGEDGRVHSTMGMACMLMREWAPAQRHLELALARVPEHVGTWHALGWTRLLQGDRIHALQAFREALDRDRNFAESHGAVGLLLTLTGQQAQAMFHLEVADRLDRNNVTGRYARAVLAGEAGDAERLNALARHLLDRPGFFGGRLSDSLDSSQ